MLGAGQNVTGVSVLQLIGAGVTGNAQMTVISGFSPIKYQVHHYKNDIVFDPATQGNIISLTWELWYKWPGSQSTYGILKMIAKQGNGEYVANPSYTEPASNSAFWQKASGALLPSDYVLFAGPGPSTLQFSPTAPPIHFGYMNFTTVDLFTSTVNHQVSFFDLQISTVPLKGWFDLGSGLAGTVGVPALAGSGTLDAGSTGTVALASAIALSPAVLFVAAASTPAPFKGGVLVPVPAPLPVALVTDGGGAILIGFTWPSGVPQGTTVFLQCAIQDAGAVNGVALSNALEAITP